MTISGIVFVSTVCATGTGKELAFQTNEGQWIWAGMGRDLTQVLLMGESQSSVLAVFDHAGDLLRAEQSYDTDRSRKSWPASFDFKPAMIKVKAFPLASDFDVGWARQFDHPGDEPEDYANARDFINRWLAAGRYRLGGCCGGWWYDGKTGEPVGDV